MVDQSELQKSETLLMRETWTVEALNLKILQLEQEINDLWSLKSAYGSDTRALNTKLTLTSQ